MKKLPSELLIWIVSMILCSGCSVKENRSLCPCRLVLDFSEVDTSVVKSVDMEVTSDGFVFTDELASMGMCSEQIVYVPRKRVGLGIWNGAEGLRDGKGIHIPLGKDSPPVYFHVAGIDADCEMVHEKVIMRKNHCRLTVNIEHGESEPWKVCIYGNVDGYMPDGSPSVGDFRYEPSADDGGGYKVILPRQLDDSLAMEIDDGSGVLKHFSLGIYVKQSGYDWDEPDLKDLTIDIDVAFAQITLSVQGWDKVYKFDMVI